MNKILHFVAKHLNLKTNSRDYKKVSRQEMLSNYFVAVLTNHHFLLG